MWETQSFVQEGSVQFPVLSCLQGLSLRLDWLMELYPRPRPHVVSGGHRKAGSFNSAGIFAYYARTNSTGPNVMPSRIMTRITHS